MAKQIQLRRGTEAENNAFTGALAELTVDTTNKSLRLHDNVTAGGVSLVNNATNQTIAGIKTFTSSPIAPTPTAGDKSTKIATTEFVQANVGISLVTANSLYAGLSSANTFTAKQKISTTGSGKALTIDRTSTTAYNGVTLSTNGVNNFVLFQKNDATGDIFAQTVDDTGATTGTPFVIERATGIMNLIAGSTVGGEAIATTDSPALIGTPTAPTPTAGDNSTKIATTAYVKTEIPNALNASGTAPIYACRAWVNFNGTGTVAIRASGNVSSITDNGTGEYTVNFTTAMPDTNYSAVGSSANQNINAGNSNCAIGIKSNSSIGISIYKTDNVATDAEMVSIQIAR